MTRVYKPLGELGTIVTGKTPKTDVKEYWDGDIPFITPTDVSGYDTYYQTETERYITALGASRQKTTVIPPNSVCVTCIGSTVGKSCLSVRTSITNQQINTIIPNEGNDYRYILYLLRYNLPYIQLIGGGSGSGTPIISKNKFSKFKFLVETDLSVQQRIASILSAYDKLIENNNKRIRILEKMAENLYKEWFVRFRFPGHENVLMENGLPKGWYQERLSSVLEIRYGKDHKNIDNGDIPVYGSGGIMRYGNKALHSGCSVLIPRKGSLNNILYVEGDFWTVDTMFYSVPKIPNIARYIYFVLTEIDMVSLNTGAALPSMTTDTLNRMKIIIPDSDILYKFESIVRWQYKQTDALKSQNANLARQRNLLLPRLMSGKLSINVD